MIVSSTDTLRIGIDASNLLGGGGRTHFIELLAHLDPSNHGIAEVIVWGSDETLSFVQPRKWLRLYPVPELSSSVLSRLIWQRWKLSRLASGRCDVLFVPGATYVGSFRPVITMSRNLLPFDHSERKRFGTTWTRFRYHLLERSQRRTFKHAAGIIFLTEYAKEAIAGTMSLTGADTAVVHHGVNAVFEVAPRRQKAISQYSTASPFSWLYVSIVNLYKHQWTVVEAVSELRKQGLPVTLDLVGPAYPPAMKRLEQAIQKHDPGGSFVRYHGAVPHVELAAYYRNADGFVFASSCETFGQILVEAMRSGLPIACSTKSAMPEILREGGKYFEPEDSHSIQETMRGLMLNPQLRESCANKAYQRSKDFTWDRCAHETFTFIVDVACRYRQDARL